MRVIKKEFAGFPTVITRRIFQISSNSRRDIIIITPACNNCRQTGVVSCLHFRSWINN